jgi:hypothetical protein
VTEEDYLRWLEGLPERFRKAMELGGFKGSNIAWLCAGMRWNGATWATRRSAIYFITGDWEFEQQQRAAAGL